MQKKLKQIGILLVKTILATLLAVFLSSCRTSDRVLNTENCQNYYEYVDIEGKKYIDPELSTCFCRNYRFSSGYVGPTGGVVDMPLNYCSKMPGFVKWEDVATFWELVRRDIQEGQGEE
jgi:hypothetical protein